MEVNRRVVDLFGLEEDVKGLRLLGGDVPTVVLMNGCFDLLHPGHAACIEHAMTYGTHLIVAVDGDERVQSLKGPGLPVREWGERVELVAHLRAVWRATKVGLTVNLSHIMDAAKPDLYVVRPHGSGDEEAKVDVAHALHRRIPVLILPRHGDWSTTRELEHIRSGKAQAGG